MWYHTYEVIIVAETWLYNPWVIAIGSGIVLLLFEEMISAYKKSIFSSATLATNVCSLLFFYETNLLYIYNTNTKMTFQIILIPNGVMYNQSLFRNFGFCL